MYIKAQYFFSLYPLLAGFLEYFNELKTLLIFNYTIINFKTLTFAVRSRAAVARRAHNPKVTGSIPVFATKRRTVTHPTKVGNSSNPFFIKEKARIFSEPF